MTSPAPHGALEIRSVSKSYSRAGRRTDVLRDVNLRIAEGEFVAILGFSGAGKTTLISLLAGLAEPDSGRILIDGRPIQGAGPERAVVFQNYSLLPWLSVRGNIALAVNQIFAGQPAAERKARVDRFIEMVHLTPAVDKKPRQLSGGMRQRVAVARALASDPKILLLDEPFGALDALTRSSLQREVEQIWEAERKTVVMITNDVDEGLILADRVVVLTPGPGATLGREFEVKLARPRDRTALNHDPAFKALRNDILLYLRSLNSGGKSAAAAPDASRALASASAMSAAPDPATLSPTS